MTTLEVVACGPATTIQDEGRRGWSRFGLPTSGAMDVRALRAANMLVGNASDEAAIEMALAGLAVRVRGGPVGLAVAGAPARIDVDGRRIEMDTAFVVEDGQTVRISAIIAGVYAMLAVHGGFDIALALGSRSLDARAAIGGFNGRALRPGDRVPLRGVTQPQEFTRRGNPVSLDREAPIRVVMGPQEAAFTDRGLQTFIDRSFTVSHSISRMAYLLNGPSIERVPGMEMISDGTLRGSVQVPPDGQPLVLMADRQTVGGYPKIATVIGADLGRLAQRRPGEELRFAPVTAVEAREIARQAHALEQAVLATRLAEPWAMEAGAWRVDGIADAVVDAVDADTWDVSGQ